MQNCCIEWQIYKVATLRLAGWVLSTLMFAKLCQNGIIDDKVDYLTFTHSLLANITIANEYDVAIH